MSELVHTNEAIKEIASSWRKTTQAILDTAKILKKYQLESNWSEIQAKLDSDGIIKISVQKFLLGIGNNPTLMNELNYQKLPPHYNTLYHLSTIKSDKLEKLIDKEEVNISTDLADARELALKYSEKKKTKAPAPKFPKVTFVITLNTHMGIKTKANRIYNQLINEFGDEAVHMKLDV
jgi:hypothetical protein